MRQTLAVSSAAEGVTGLSLLFAPRLVFWLLFGAELPTGSDFLCRIAGGALLSLALACWPFQAYSPALRRQRLALLAYNLLTAVLLAAAGATGPAGPLLWPAVILHAAIAALLAAQRPAGSLDLV